MTVPHQQYVLLLAAGTYTTEQVDQITHTALIINARFGVLPFLLTFTLQQYYCYTTSLADKREFKVQNMYEDTLASRTSYRQTSSVIEI